MPMPQQPAGAGAGGGVDTEKAKLDQMVQHILSTVTKPQQGGIGAPSPRQDPQGPGMQQQQYKMGRAYTKQEDIGNVLYNAGTLIHNLSAQFKQNQVRDAVADWQSLDHSLQKAQLAAGDPSAPDYKQKVQQNLAQMPWVKAFLDPSNPKSVKRLKNMYKALNQNIFDEKENVYGQALKQFDKAKKAEGQIAQHKEELDKAKQQTMESRMKSLAGAGQMTPPDPKNEIDALKAAADVKRAGMEKYDFKQGQVGTESAGQWFAFDKTNPSNPAKRVQIDGQDIKSPVKPMAHQGQVLSIEGKPYGVISGPKVVTASDPEFQTDENVQRKMNDANKAYAVAEANKFKLAGVRAEALARTREYGVIKVEPDGTKALTMASASEINKHPGQYAPATGAMGVQMKDAVFDDIAYNSGNVRDAVKNLKSGFSPGDRAQLLTALMSDDPKDAVHTFVSSLAKGTLKDDQVDYVTALAALEENAYALRGVAGMGSGSDTLRHAIARAIPGVGTPTAKYANRQLDIFDGILSRLKKGLPDIGEGGEIPMDQVAPKATKGGAKTPAKATGGWEPVN